MHVVDLEGSTTVKVLISDVASEKATWQEDRQQNWLLKDAGDKVQDAIGPVLKESNTIREAVSENGASHAKSNLQYRH